MLLHALTVLPWQDSLINTQHIVNEIVLYLMCTGLVSFSGPITETIQAQVFGWLLVLTFIAMVSINITIILYDSLRYLQLLMKRYYKSFPQCL